MHVACPWAEHAPYEYMRPEHEASLKPSADACPKEPENPLEDVVGLEVPVEDPLDSAVPAAAVVEVLKASDDATWTNPPPLAHDATAAPVACPEERLTPEAEELDAPRADAEARLCDTPAPALELVPVADAFSPVGPTGCGSALVDAEPAAAAFPRLSLAPASVPCDEPVAAAPPALAL